MHTGPVGVAKQSRRIKRENLTRPEVGRTYGVEEILSMTGADRALLRSLEQYGLVRGDDGFDDGEREVIKAAVELRAYGLEPRHLRTLKVAAAREAGLLEQVLATGLKSSNPERRQESLESLESLAALASHVRHLILVQELRTVVRSLAPTSQENA